MRKYPPVRPEAGAVDPGRGGGVIFLLVAIALLLAVGFFYMTLEKRADRRADAAVGAAESLDNAARAVGDAAQNAADRLHKND